LGSFAPVAFMTQSRGPQVGLALSSRRIVHFTSSILLVKNQDGHLRYLTSQTGCSSHKVCTTPFGPCRAPSWVGGFVWCHWSRKAYPTNVNCGAAAADIVLVFCASFIPVSCMTRRCVVMYFCGTSTITRGAFPSLDTAPRCENRNRSARASPPSRGRDVGMHRLSSGRILSRPVSRHKPAIPGR
jgi:hypothetical protein